MRKYLITSVRYVPEDVTIGCIAVAWEPSESQSPYLFWIPNKGDWSTMGNSGAYYSSDLGHTRSKSSWNNPDFESRLIPEFNVGQQVSISSNSGGYTYSSTALAGRKATITKVNEMTGGLDLLVDYDGIPCSQTNISPFYVQLVPKEVTRKMSTDEMLMGKKLMEEVKEKSIDELLAEAEKKDPTPAYAKWAVKPVPEDMVWHRPFTDDEEWPIKKEQKLLQKNPRAYWEEELDEMVEEEEEILDEEYYEEDEDNDFEEETKAGMPTNIDDLIDQAEEAEGESTRGISKFKIKEVKKVKDHYEIEVGIDFTEKERDFDNAHAKVFKPRTPAPRRRFRAEEIL
jgi:hypothetical protein